MDIGHRGENRQHSGGRDHGTECDCADGSLEVPTRLSLAEEPHKGEGRTGGDDEDAGHSDERCRLPCRVDSYTVCVHLA